MGVPSLKIAITTGDRDGVGLEVTTKALRGLGPQRGVHFLLWRSLGSYPKNLDQLAKKFKIVSFSSSSQALTYLLSKEMSWKTLIELISDESPAKWVEETAAWCFEKRIHGMVTGPISKLEIHRAGLQDMGHTDILRRVSKTQKVFMGFLGSEFNVLLATAHIPIAEISSKLNVENLRSALLGANLLRCMLPSRIQKRPIALVGLNPHAGESGLIGDEESVIFPKLLLEAKELKIDVCGPLSPDAAFQKENWKKYSLYLAMYHDQGLIPFKLIHGQDSGVHISVGLPFVRTSVDHGTAKDIFAKDKANSSSMKDAIQTCTRLIRSSIH